MTSIFCMIIWHGSYDLQSNVIIQRINYKYIINNLVIFGIDKYYASFLFSAVYFHLKKILYNAIIVRIIKDIGK